MYLCVCVCVSHRHSHDSSLTDDSQQEGGHVTAERWEIGRAGTVCRSACVCVSLSWWRTRPQLLVSRLSIRRDTTAGGFPGDRGGGRGRRSREGEQAFAPSQSLLFIETIWVQRRHTPCGRNVRAAMKIYFFLRQNDTFFPPSDSFATTFKRRKLQPMALFLTY